MNLFNPLFSTNLKTIISGTITALDETTFSCTVKPDKDIIPELQNIPLRVYNLQNDYGIIVIPEINTPCIVGFIENAHPFLLSCQTFKKILIKSETEKLSITIFKDGKIEIQNQNDINVQTTGSLSGEISGDCTLKVSGKIQLGPSGAHKAAWGDQWLISFNQHIHPTPNGPSGPPNPPLQDSQVNSQKVSLD